ncbi:hypothetical protein MTO96_014350 [Rhipicephalus appendiculatus]
MHFFRTVGEKSSTTRSVCQLVKGFGVTSTVSPGERKVRRLCDEVAEEDARPTLLSVELVGVVRPVRPSVFRDWQLSSLFGKRGDCCHHATRGEQTGRDVVAEVIVRAGIRKWFHFPWAPDEKGAFKNVSSAAGVIGCVDGSVAVIIAPKGDHHKAASYCCKKHYADIVMLPAVSNCVRRVSQAIVNAGTRNKWVHFPRTPEEKAAVKEGFLRLGPLPGVIGCVDGSFVAIVAPRGEQKASFWCRKGYYALNVMFICDADMRILAVDPLRPGSDHDSHIWGTTWVRERIEEGRIDTTGEYLLENWARDCAHVVRLEEEAWEQDGAIESALDCIIITLGSDSSSCSDSSVSELSGIEEL